MNFSEHMLELCALCSDFRHTLLVLLISLIKAQALRFEHLPLLNSIRRVRYFRLALIVRDEKPIKRGLI